MADHPTLTDLDAALPFVDRHIGPRPEEIERMLEVLGFSSLEDLMTAAVPDAIVSSRPMDLPPPTDEQQVIQQKMMSFMMIFMGFLFFKVPSGLCIYFITSSLWGIGERKLLPKAKPKNSPPPPTDTKATEKKPETKLADKVPGGSAVKGWLESIVRAADKSNGAPSGNNGDREKRDDRRRKKKKK